MESSLMPVMNPYQEDRMVTSWLKRHGHRHRFPLPHKQPQPLGPTKPIDVLQKVDKRVEEVDEFCQVVQRYTTEMNGGVHGGGADFDIYGAHSWKEVVDIVKEVEEDYNHSATGWKGAVRLAFRKLGEHAEDFNPWLDLLPDDQYFSIVCGGLKIILGMAARRSEQREAILAFFAEVPEIIYWTDTYHTLFQHEEGLKYRLYEFYLALLAKIQGMIEKLVGISLWGKIISGLSVKSGEKSLEDTSKRFTEAKTRLEKYLQFVRDRLHVNVNKGIDHMKPLVDEIATGQKQVIQQNSSLQNDVRQLSRKFEPNMFMEQMRAVLRDEIKKAQWQDNQDTMRREHRQWQILHQGYPRSEIFFFLGLNEQNVREQLIQDLDDTGRGGQDIDMAAQAHARQLLRMAQFRNWIRSGQAEMLYVDGNCDEYAMARCSPFSLLCCALVHELVQQSQSQVLFFFCGLHNLAGDSMAGPVGLVKSLIVQLLLETKDEYDLFFLTLERMEEALRDNDLLALCTTLKEMLMQNRSPTLLCVLDGVSSFEVQNWRQDMEYVIQVLFDLTTDSKLQTIFKILITSPGMSRLARDVVPPACRVYLPETNELIADTESWDTETVEDEMYRGENVRSTMYTSNAGRLESSPEWNNEGYE